jgi:hypothetical protein
MNPNINYPHLRDQILRGHRVMVAGVEYARVEDLPADLPGYPAAPAPEPVLPAEVAAPAEQQSPTAAKAAEAPAPAKKLLAKRK